MAKILIAEDERDIRNLLAFTLQFAGHQVIATADGAEALEAARRDMPDLIVLDIRMPRMSGYEACKQIKAEDTLKHIPIVFLTAKGQEAELQAGYALGAEEYIIKPFAPDQLTERLQAVLAKGL